MKEVKETLKITIIQSDIFWESPETNLEKYEQLLENLCDTDVIIFPEMFTTGFSMAPGKLKTKMDGESVLWMKKLAVGKNSAVIGSLIIEENDKIYNRAIWCYPNGNIETYDKRHLYTMGQEHLHYSAGRKKNIISFKGWKFCPLICYDLRFPVWSRNAEDYDVLIYMANWPSPRHHVWKNLLIARAIENQAYCFGINRTGVDGTGLSYLGDSGFISPKGRGNFVGDKELIHTFEISYSELHDFRSKFPLLNDRDTFTVNY